MAGARLQGAERIVCVDLSEERLEMARGQGATDTFVGGPDSVERVLEMTGGMGADYTFEATGNVNVMRQAVESARMGWGLCTVTGVAGKGETLDVIPRFLITGRRIAGSSFGGVKGRDQVPVFVERYLDGEIDVDALISHKLSLDRGERGLRPDARPGRHPQRDRLLMPRHRPGPARDHVQRPRVGRGGARARRRRAPAGARPARPRRRGRGSPGPTAWPATSRTPSALLDAEGLDRAVVAGHSMGAYVTALLAATHPDRVQSVVLVDGGPPLPVPDGADPDALLEATLGPSIERLSREFETPRGLPRVLARPPGLRRLRRGRRRPDRPTPTTTCAASRPTCAPAWPRRRCARTAAS